MQLTSVKNWPRYTLLFFQDGDRRRLLFVIPSFLTTYDGHDVPFGQLYVPCKWRNDQLEFDIAILPFRYFG